MRRTAMGFAVIAFMFVLFAAVVLAQQAKMPAPDTLPDGPRIFDSSRRGPSGRRTASAARDRRRVPGRAMRAAAGEQDGGNERQGPSRRP